MVTLQIKRLDPKIQLPTHAHPGDAGLDLSAAEGFEIKPGERALVPTGIALAIPEGFAGFVQPRSGLAAKKGLGIINSPGLIDSGYRGEVKVILINLDPFEPIRIERGERIAQLVVLAVPAVDVQEVDDLPSAQRGEGGFGSSGT